MRGVTIGVGSDVSSQTAAAAMPAGFSISRAERIDGRARTRNAGGSPPEPVGEGGQGLVDVATRVTSFSCRFTSSVVRHPQRQRQQQQQVAPFERHITHLYSCPFTGLPCLWAGGRAP
ncbi:unnamed protein product [Lampetra planeri]